MTGAESIQYTSLPEARV